MALTLDEMLELLPTNSSGEISAADLRAIVTALDERLVAADVRVTRNEQEFAASQDEQIFTVTGRWQINSNANQVPGGGQMTFDTGTAATATWVRFSIPDKNNEDGRLVLARTVRIFAQMAMDSSKWVNWDVAGEVINQSSYVQVPVTFVTGAGAPGSAAWQDALVVLMVAADDE